MAVGSGGEALAIAKQKYLDGIALGLDIADIPAVQLVEEIQVEGGSQTPPIVIFGAENSDAAMEQEIRRLSRHSLVRYADTPDRLLEESVLFLHRVIADLPEEKQKMLDRLHHSDDALVGKKVLVVDDDVRNIFALSSVLERRGMAVLTASTGREAIAQLESTDDVAIVLMDIMMPEMDGYQTMQVIRENSAFRRLPIIALTAKAMKGDREKCLEAGASEYLAKPVNTEQLLSALRMWLHR